MGFTKLVKKAREYGKLVMFSHTVFSLGFALLSMLLAAGGLPKLSTVFWILICFLGARTGANAINRVIDAKIDAQNPRTADRQLPRGELRKGEVAVFTAVCFLAMLAGAYQLNWVCLFLSPAALFLMIIYSYTKRFTCLCHLVLGLTCACAPVGAWLAVRGFPSGWEELLLPLGMGAANTLWVAGFDIIYGSQDYEFDRSHGLHSIPVAFGVKSGLRIAKAFHLLTVILLAAVGLLAGELGVIYFVGVAIIAVLLAIQYRLVSPGNLANVKIASYSINQVVGIVLLVFGLLDVFL